MKRSIKKRKKKRPRVDKINITLAGSPYNRDDVQKLIEEINDTIEDWPQPVIIKKPPGFIETIRSLFARFLTWIFKL